MTGLTREDQLRERAWGLWGHRLISWRGRYWLKGPHPGGPLTDRHVRCQDNGLTLDEVERLLAGQVSDDLTVMLDAGVESVSWPPTDTDFESKCDAAGILPNRDGWTLQSCYANGEEQWTRLLHGAQHDVLDETVVFPDARKDWPGSWPRPL